MQIYIKYLNTLNSPSFIYQYNVHYKSGLLFILADKDSIMDKDNIMESYSQRLSSDHYHKQTPIISNDNSALNVVFLSQHRPS